MSDKPTIPSEQDREQTALKPQDWLAQLLDDGREWLQQAQAGSPALKDQARNLGQRAEDTVIETFGLDDSEESRANIRQQAKYAGIAGALALLIKSRSTRKIAALGGLAALGTIAYRGHQRGNMPETFQDAIGLLRGTAADERANILIKAMVAAAKADGVISPAERELIMSHKDADLDKLETLLSEPVEPDEIAALAKSDQMGAEIYAVSCRVADGLNPAERDYLDRLAMGLRLDPEAAAAIETDIRVGTS